MRPIRGHILITADKDQKQKIGDFYIVPNRQTYEQNGIETNPCVAEVLDADTGIPLLHGELIVLHHNLIMDKVWEMDTGVGGKQVSSIPFDRWVLGKLNISGELEAMPGNIVCERIELPGHREGFQIPESAVKFYHDKVKVMHSGVKEIKSGDIIGILKYADYPVAYSWYGQIQRRCVVWEKDVTCVIKNSKL